MSVNNKKAFKKIRFEHFTPLDCNLKVNPNGIIVSKKLNEGLQEDNTDSKAEISITLMNLKTQYFLLKEECLGEPIALSLRV